MAINCDTCDELTELGHDACDKLNLGNRFVALMYQDLRGTPFDGSPGNDITEPADINAKLGLTGYDKLFVIPNLNVTSPSTSPTFLAANESVTGVQEPIEYAQTQQAFLQYLTKANLTAAEKLTFCSRLLRVWFITNTGYVLGSGDQTLADDGYGFESVKFNFSTTNFAGVGTLANKPFTIEYNEQCEPKPIDLLPAFKTLTQSGFVLTP